MVRHLKYLTALASERHFARAAAQCNVTQPTLSAGIKQLEESLGAVLVKRGQHYIGLTEEGRLALVWAQRILNNYASLREEVSGVRQEPVGPLRIGAVPMTLPVSALLTTPFNQRHESTPIIVTSATAAEIERGIGTFSLDAGLVFLAEEKSSRLRTVPLFRERYVLITWQETEFANHGTVSWASAATLPLCILTSDTWSRQLLDQHAQKVGTRPQVVTETDSVIALWSHVRLGNLSAIVPTSLFCLLGKPEDTVALPLSEPDIAQIVGLVASEHDPLPPAAEALISLARTLDLQKAIDRMLSSDTKNLTSDRLYQ